MKKLLIILLFTGILWACNNDNPSTNKEIIHVSEADHQHEIISEKLVLNNGAKWKADSTTTNNVKNLLAIIEAFNSEAYKSLTSYKKTAADLQQGLDKMISECKMHGPDHEALHKWLRPLIGQVAGLKNVSTEDAASKSMATIQAQLNLYDQYFK